VAHDLSVLHGLDPDGLSEAELRAGLGTLLNLVEPLVAEVQSLKAENQRLRDEIQRLKGERGKPTFQPKRPARGGTDYSSERERRQHHGRGGHPLHLRGVG